MKLAQKAAAAEEERLRKLQAESARMLSLEMERLQKELVQWRSKVKAGDDTFCGPVIEVKWPMIRIALRVQLSGYGNDAWLKAAEVYPPSYGCRNVNGRLTPT